MNEWEKFALKILKSVLSVEPTNDKEKMMKLVIAMYIYKSLESEEVFNYNVEVLNEKRR